MVSEKLYRNSLNKSDDRVVYHSYDYRPNWTPLSPSTIINVLEAGRQRDIVGFFDCFLVVSSLFVQ